MEELGDRIREIRERQSPPPSQSEMARRLGITPPKYIRYEKGEVSPPSNFLQKILELYPATDPGWLLTGQAAAIPYFCREVLEKNIARIEAAESGERNREIITTLYMTHQFLDMAHFHGRDLIQKILNLTADRIQAILSIMRGDKPPGVELSPEKEE